MNNPAQKTSISKTVSSLLTQEVPPILTTVNALLKELISEADRIANAPARNWDAISRRLAVTELAQATEQAVVFLERLSIESVRIKNLIKLIHALKNLGSSARLIQTAAESDERHGRYGNRARGRSMLKHHVAVLNDLFGVGCEIESLLSRTETVNNEKEYYTPGEIAQMLQVSTEHVRKLFENVHGVVDLSARTRIQRRGMRPYRTLRIPRHVFLRYIHEHNVGK